MSTSISDHTLNNTNKIKTADVKITQNIKFEGMLLSETICKGLHENNYISPSPIQLKSIPLGKCGFDMLMQAKSGTGKTLAFGILALELIHENPKGLRVLILSPTREIAVQINEVLTNVGKYIENFKSHYFIGGLSVTEDIKNLIKCNIAVGAPGRVNQLIKENRLKTKDIRLLVLDEADKLMNESYIEDIEYIYSKLPKEKQVIASSATYFDCLEKTVTKFMRSQLTVTPQSDIPVLLGVKQFVTVIPHHENVMRQLKLKTEQLTRIFSSIPFKQCLVFSNYQTRAESLSYTLTSLGWPTDFITGLLQQSERMGKIKNFKQFKFRILISTDLTARGLDVENINLVINFDVPNNAATYLHRIGRAGRYGTEGISITLVDDGKDTSEFNSLLDDVDKELLVSILPPKVPENLWKTKCSDFETYHGSEEKYSNVIETSEDNTDVKSSDYGTPMLKSEVKDDVVLKNTCLLELGKIFVKNNKKVTKLDPFETYVENVDIIKCAPENNTVFNITDNTVELIEHLLKLIKKEELETNERIKKDCENLSCDEIVKRLLAGEVLSLNSAPKNTHVKNFATIKIKGDNENEVSGTDNLNLAPKNVHVKNFATIKIKGDNENKVSGTDNLNLAPKNAHVKNFATIKIKGDNENEVSGTDDLNLAPKNTHVKNFATIKIKGDNENEDSGTDSLNLALKNVHVKKFATIEIQDNNENISERFSQVEVSDNLNLAPKNVHVKNFATIEINDNNESRVRSCKKKSLKRSNVVYLENSAQVSNSYNYCTQSGNSFDWYDLWQDQMSSIQEYVRRCKY